MTAEQAMGPEQDFSTLTDDGWDEVQHHVVWPYSMGDTVVHVVLDALTRDPFGHGFLGYRITADQLRKFSGALRHDGGKRHADHFKRAAWAAEHGKIVAMWMVARGMIKPTAEKTLIDWAFEMWSQGQRNIARACVVDHLRDGDAIAFVQTIEQCQPEGFAADMLEIKTSLGGSVQVIVQPIRPRA